MRYCKNFTCDCTERFSKQSVCLYALINNTLTTLFASLFRVFHEYIRRSQVWLTKTTTASFRDQLHKILAQLRLKQIQAYLDRSIASETCVSNERRRNGGANFVRFQSMAVATHLTDIRIALNSHMKRAHCI